MKQLNNLGMGDSFCVLEGLRVFYLSGVSSFSFRYLLPLTLCKGSHDTQLNIPIKIGHPSLSLFFSRSRISYHLFYPAFNLAFDKVLLIR